MEASNELSSLVRREVAASRLGHGARDTRLEAVADGLAAGADKSLPQAFPSWTALKSAYRFFANERVTPEAILSGHVQRTVARCRQLPVVLLVQDTTVLTLQHEVAGAGRVGPHGVQGLFVHTCLAVSGEEGHAVCGTLAQEAWARGARKRGRRRSESGRQRKARPVRESLRWAALALTASEALGEGPGRPHVVHVFDREGDIFEALEMLDALQDSWVVRASRNRRLDTSEGDAEAAYLESTLRAAPVRGHYGVQVPPGPGRRARTARLEVRARRVALLPPANRKRRGEALQVNCVLAEETHPPQGETPLCWMLLTREPIATLTDCLAVVDMYTARWRIEELHMGLKTGCGVEKRQLHAASRVQRFLALATILAWGLLALRDAARASPSPPATHHLSDEQLRLLARLRPEMPAHPNAYEALRALARLGGFIGRKSDGEPGWRTLWRGLDALLAAELGYRLALTAPGPPDFG